MARVVTDWSAAPWGGRGNPRGFCELRLGDYRSAVFSCSLGVIDTEAWERDTRREVATMRDQLGARAMGKR